MRRSFTRGPFGRWLLIATTVVALRLGDTAWAQERQKQVLVLYSTRQDAQIVIVGDRELPRILGDGLPAGIDYYTEHIDQARFSHPEYQIAFRDSLRLKYEHHRFDVVIAMGDIPLDFVDRNRDLLFAGAPVVFFRDQPLTRPIANATGVVVERNLSGTLALAAALQPDLRQVFIVTGAAGRTCWTSARGAVATVRISIRHHLSVWSADEGSRGAAGIIARAVRRLLCERRSGRRRSELPAVGLPGPRHGSGQCAGVQLGGLGDGSRHRRRRPEGPDTRGAGGRRHRSARASRRAGRLHPDVFARSECQSGRLASAAALGDQRSARACWNS